MQIHWSWVAPSFNLQRLCRESSGNAAFSLRRKVKESCFPEVPQAAGGGQSQDHPRGRVLGVSLLNTFPTFFLWLKPPASQGSPFQDWSPTFLRWNTGLWVPNEQPPPCSTTREVGATLLWSTPSSASARWPESLSTCGGANRLLRAALTGGAG